MISVLVLCTGNSARSILGEAILNHLGKGLVQAHSAGSQPRPEPHPAAIELLRDLGHDTSGLRSKSWDEFAAPDAPPINLVITVCDSAAAETCPVWPGGPEHVHWGQPDPAAEQGPGDSIETAFRDAYATFEARARALLALDLDQPIATHRPQIAAISQDIPCTPTSPES